MGRDFLNSYNRGGGCLIVCELQNIPPCQTSFLQLKKCDTQVPIEEDNMQKENKAKTFARHGCMLLWTVIHVSLTCYIPPFEKSDLALKLQPPHFQLDFRL